MRCYSEKMLNPIWVLYDTNTFCRRCISASASLSCLRWMYKVYLISDFTVSNHPLCLGCWQLDEAWLGVYTVKDCYPVQETYTRNSSVTTSTRFFDLKLGISDPSVFTPPSTCQSAHPERMASGCWVALFSLGGWDQTAESPWLGCSLFLHAVIHST